ncbi:pirin family protein [Myxococcota bacterium]
MIQLCKADERYCQGRRGQRVWYTFYSQDQTDPRADEFRNQGFLSESRLRPGERVAPQPWNEGEAVNYVREGALMYTDSRGHSAAIVAGEFQRGTVGHGSRQTEANASRSHSAHVFRISLRPSKVERDRDPEQKRFTTAQRRNSLCVVASQDGREGSLRIHQDALIISSIFEDGHHFAHELRQGRSAWLHLVQGEGTLGDIDLTTGDGAGITAERAVSFTAHEGTEILLVDVGEEVP